jgi:hypothetical protein
VRESTVFRYGTTVDTASELQGRVTKSDADPWWLLKPRGATVIPVFGKADSMTIAEKWGVQLELAQNLYSCPTFKWVNLREQFTLRWRRARGSSKAEDARQVAMANLAIDIGKGEVPVPTDQDHADVACNFDGVGGGSLNDTHFFNANPGEYYKAYVPSPL